MLPTFDWAPVFLQPGEFRFGQDLQLTTLLGSCVAITCWHPERRLAGMCHYLLPSRHRAVGQSPDGRYADEAVEWLMARMLQADTQAWEYRYKMFGGGNMFPHLSVAHGQGIGERNVAAGRELLQQRGLNLQALHVGGIGHRQVVLNANNGDVWMRQAQPNPRVEGRRPAALALAP